MVSKSLERVGSRFRLNSRLDAGARSSRLREARIELQIVLRHVLSREAPVELRANAQIAALCLPKERKAPRRQAIGSRTNVPSVTRPNATTTGESSCTDSLMKKYGRPQMMPSAAKAPHARQLTRYP